MKNKPNTLVSIIIIILFVGLMVAAAYYYKGDASKQPASEQANMQNTANDQGIAAGGPAEGAPDTLLKQIVKEGSGPAIGNGQTAVVNYTGMFTDGAPFDSNVDPAFNHVQPFEFKLGENRVIQGWEIGVAGMKVGEVMQLYIPAEYAYGATGQGPIPPNTPLVFNIELLAIK